MNLPTLLQKARRSRLHRWLLNIALPWVIPFNRPHGFTVDPLAGGGIAVRVPYRRINRNHIRGIHACALATASEMCSGLSVLEQLDPKRYRLIMRSLNMVYHFQAREAAVATCGADGGAQGREVAARLAIQDAVEHTSVVEVHDRSGRHLATGTIVWQVKPWSKVRTRL
jgi:acyl-coenzyme A thioesterase PaaI-like protein